MERKEPRSDYFISACGIGESGKKEASILPKRMLRFTRIPRPRLCDEVTGAKFCWIEHRVIDDYKNNLR